MREITNKKNIETCFNVRIAGLDATIRTVYTSSYVCCHDYLSDGKPLFTVEVTRDDIQREMKKVDKFFFTRTEFTGKKNEYTVIKETNESWIEAAIVHRKFVEAALDYERFFMHGAVIGIENSSIMFTAPSGTGKTTHIMKWINGIQNAYIVNGDKPLIHIEKKNDVIACGTPWCGKENLGTNTMVPLKTIVIMERCETNKIEEIDFGQAYPFLLRQTYLPDDAEKAKKTLNLMAKLFGRVRVFRFKFNNMSDDCFDIAYNTLIGTL